MMARGWRLRLGAVVMLAALVTAMGASGCGGDDGGIGTGGARSPLADFFGYDDFRPGEEPEHTEQDRQLHYQWQERIAACMRVQGFDFVPEPFEADVLTDGHRQWNELQAMRYEDPEQFARQYGYGVHTLNVDDYIDEYDPAGNPNWIYREGLSRSAKEEYDRALHGDWGSEAGAADNAGCWEEALEEVYDHEATVAQEWARFEIYFQEIQALFFRVETDPRLTAAWRDWSDCLAAAGYPGVTARHDITEQLDQAGLETYGGPLFEGDPPEFDSLEEQVEFYESLERYEPTVAELAALRAFELDLAWADFSCRRDARVDQVEREVRFELEEQFIADHRELLEEYRNYLIEQGMVG